MIKSELIAKLADENPHLTQKDVERVVSVIFDKMTDALVGGGRVELRGFGAFSVRARPARAGATLAPARRWRCVRRRCPFSRAARSCASG